jgi:hypothetical protein
MNAEGKALAIMALRGMDVLMGIEADYERERDPIDDRAAIAEVKALTAWYRRCLQAVR